MSTMKIDLTCKVNGTTVTVSGADTASIMSILARLEDENKTSAKSSTKKPAAKAKTSTKSSTKKPAAKTKTSTKSSKKKSAKKAKTDNASRKGSKAPWIVEDMQHKLHYFQRRKSALEFVEQHMKFMGYDRVIKLVNGSNTEKLNAFLKTHTWDDVQSIGFNGYPSLKDGGNKSDIHMCSMWRNTVKSLA